MNIGTCGLQAALLDTVFFGGSAAECTKPPVYPFRQGQEVPMRFLNHATLETGPDVENFKAWETVGNWTTPKALLLLAVVLSTIGVL